MSELWWTPRQVAEELRVSPQTVWKWLRRGKLRGHRAGRVWRIAGDDLWEFLRPGRFEAEPYAVNRTTIAMPLDE